MFANLRARRIIITALCVTSLALGFVLILMPSPDLSLEQELQRQIARLASRVQLAERVNVDRKDDLQSLFNSFSHLTQSLMKSNNASGGKKPINLGIEAEAMLQGQNWTYDLSLPSIRYALPHVVQSPKSLSPAFKWSKGRSQVSMVLGIPTVKRDHQSYLQSTLRSVFNNIQPEDESDTLVVIFIAETDISFVKETAQSIKAGFAAQLESGILEVISPPIEYYPVWSNLKRTLGDPSERVQWRSKQNLDYAFLMMYAQWRGTFYVQLEDDILTKPYFVATMRDFALEKNAAHEPWFVIDFCQLGFIGKMFSTSSLPLLIQFLLSFYNDKPGDWLLDNVIQTKVCKLDQDFKKCQKEKQSLWIHYKPSLFQHIGTHSSLKGKVQKLKDKQFGKVSLFTPHRNPPATFETKIKHYKQYSLTRAYRGETFYWGLVPQPGDYILFKFVEPTELSGFKFVSGNAEHPSDRFEETTIEILPENPHIDLTSLNLQRSSDGNGYVIVGFFDENGVAEGNINARIVGLIKELRIVVGKSHENWAILSEMYLRTPDREKLVKQ